MDYTDLRSFFCFLLRTQRVFLHTDVTDFTELHGYFMDVASYIPTGLATPSSLCSVVFASSQRQRCEITRTLSISNF